ncbi:hypothetical protein E6C67_26830 [Azospirillum sp. TSA2s]|uniref:hypothetical protein n=1 Tax=Azospirillum sp. TSA2s TaxID=709810 RepID=UPI0010AACD15|nr:hypothetical protein [Azospirillum sp. TSA2s]QCG97389.1 hypothetical protein E6C67_26830 [Azospirillum sp. TSA2s]
MDRRSLLKGGAAAVLFAPIAGAPVQATEDDHLLSLWRAYIEIEDRLADISERKRAAIAKMPEWVRWGGVGKNGVREFAPEWRPAIRRRHSVPDDFPRRPLEDDVKALNKKLVYEAVGRWIEENYPANALREWMGAGLSEELLKARVAAHASPDVIAEQERGVARLLEHARQWTIQRRWEKKAGLPELQKEEEDVLNISYELKWPIIETPHNSSVGMLIRLKMFAYIKSEHSESAIEELDTVDQFIIRMVHEMERGLLSEAAALIPPFPKLDAYMRSAVA